jgi:hypothetical protein
MIVVWFTLIQTFDKSLDRCTVMSHLDLNLGNKRKEIHPIQLFPPKSPKDVYPSTTHNRILLRIVAFFQHDRYWNIGPTEYNRNCG